MDTIQISTKIDARLREDFDHARVRRHKKINEAVEEALREWVHRDEQSPQAEETSKTAIPIESSGVHPRETGAISNAIALIGQAFEELSSIQESPVEGQGTNPKPRKAAGKRRGPNRQGPGSGSKNRE